VLESVLAVPSICLIETEVSVINAAPSAILLTRVSSFLAFLTESPRTMQISFDVDCTTLGDIPPQSAKEFCSLIAIAAPRDAAPRRL